ncbi:MAG: filamentous hemagglutinin N-terminal domain-containing protein, partial [Xenococcaceae cyanobacterium MO_207.B15]|nr:filamentous hemagglutinin N-terminal domain-containing protein [Xenococcaceae cyanobacterium MO_207.B15]
MDIFKTSQNVFKPNVRQLQIQLILAFAQSFQSQSSKSHENFWLVPLILIASLFNNNLEASAQIIPDNTLPSNSIVTPNGDILQISGGTTAGNNLFHSFEAFSVLTGQTASFDNGLAIQNILGRITGNSISNIDGLIRANGGANLFLINPNGIVFGENASLDIGGSFVATTADRIRFGEDGFFSASDPQNSQLLTVKPEVFFENALANVEGNIVNQGDLAVASQQTLSFLGRNISNTGNLTAPGGIVGIFGSKSVALSENATIDVSFPTGGGTVLIGGDFQGSGILPTSKRTYIGENVTIKADALTNGNGGEVIVWADEVTGFYGNISAKGGLESGHGGSVEVSGKEHLIFRGNVNTSAVNGLPGTLLLDPIDIVIADGSGDKLGDGTDSLAGNNSGVEGSILSESLSDIEDTAPTTIYESELEGLSGDTNIILQATNDIRLEDLSDDGLELAAGAGVIALSADADGDGVGDFIMEDNIADTIFTNGRDIAISGANLTIGNINTSLLIVGDAGELTETALFISDSPGEVLESISISGNISNTEDVDLFQIYLPGEGTFSATTIDGTTIDTQLFLFDADGLGVYANDDQAGCNCAQSTLPANNDLTPTEPGVYYLGISTIGNEPVSSGGVIFPSSFETGFETIRPATGNGGLLPLTEWSGGFVQGSYQINLTGVEAPTASILESIQPLGDSGSINLNATNGNITARSLNTTSSLADAGAVSLNASGNITMNDRIETFANLGDGKDVLLTAGGDITLNPRASILSNGSSAGDITLNSQGDISIIRSSIISTNRSQNESSGSSGNITMTANSIFLTDGTEITANTVAGQNNSGLIQLTAEDSISLTGQNLLGGSRIANQVTVVDENTSGSSAGIVIESQNLFLSDGAQISASTEAAGNAGAITIQADRITLEGESSSTIFRPGVPTSISSQANPGATGRSGDINIDTRSFSLKDGARVSTTTFGQGDAGAIFITAKDNITIEGESSRPDFTSNIQSSVSPTAEGTGGSITIDTGSLFLKDGGQLNTFTLGIGSAGEIFITARDNITIEGESSRPEIVSGIFSGVRLGAEGTAGDITINTDSFSVKDSAVVSAETRGVGDGGTITVNALQSVLITNKGTLTVQTRSVGKPGDITITTPNLMIGQDAQLSATATETSTNTDEGGSITVNASKLNLTGQ